MRLATQCITASVIATFALLAQAEISGSGSPNANCAGAQIGGRLALDDSPSSAGLDRVRLFLEGDGQVLSAYTGGDGRYLFFGLCAGDFQLTIDQGSLPGGLTLTKWPAGDEDDDSDSDSDPIGRNFNDGWEIELEDDNERRLDVDFSFAGTPEARCLLGVEARCAIPSLATELYVCSKRVHELRMVWNGFQPVRVIAYNGKPDDEILVDIDGVLPGDLVTVGQMHDAPDDVVWEVYAAGSDFRLGESKFHLDCDDPQMDGPEDCLAAQGDGKDDKSGRINDWLFSGLTDAGGEIDCAAPVYQQTCHFEPTRADCEALEEVHTLTFQYRGNACADSRHHQPDKFECEGTIDGVQPATITLKDDTRFTVMPGEAFSIPSPGSSTEIELTNGGGTQRLKIHTSCSQPLAAGNSFGALTLGAINGLGVGTPVDFSYRVVNLGDADAGIVVVSESAPSLFDPAAPVAAQSSVTFHGSRWLDRTLTNEVSAAGTTESSSCAATDEATAVVTDMSPCEVMELEREFHNEEIRWRLKAGDAAAATISRVELDWPVGVAGKLKEMKLDGDKFYDRDDRSGRLIVDTEDFSDDLKKRRIKRANDREMKIKFDKDIDRIPADYAVTVHFEEGCSVSF